jgi:hemolysin III
MGVKLSHSAAFPIDFWVQGSLRGVFLQRLLRETRIGFAVAGVIRSRSVNPTNQTIPQIERSYSRAEEITHWASHGAGFAGALIGAPFLIHAALRNGGGLALVGVIIFAVTAALLYLSSTVYHGLPPGRAKDACEVLDHAAIYLLIAGTYTPFTLGVLRGTLGWTLLGLVWTIAAVGVTLKAIHGVRYPKLSVALYVGMGWLIVVAARTLYMNLPLPGLLWLAGGGIAYTVGVLFYLNKQIRFGHFVWHLFVLGGTACHYFAVLWYAV